MLTPALGFGGNPLSARVGYVVRGFSAGGPRRGLGGACGHCAAAECCDACVVQLAMGFLGPQARDDEAMLEGAVPAYLLDREGVSRAKVLSNTLKEKRKEKAGRWAVPLPKVKPIADAETFKVVTTGKRRLKQWKRQINKVTFVGEGFTRKPPKYERFIRPAALRMKKANVTHPELKVTFCLPILGVKLNPQGQMYTSLNVITKGTLIEIDVGDLGLVTPSGKVIFSQTAQVMNNPELDGTINAILLV